MTESVAEMQKAVRAAAAMVSPEPLVVPSGLYRRLLAAGVDMEGCVEQRKLPTAEELGQQMLDHAKAEGKEAKPITYQGNDPKPKLGPFSLKVLLLAARPDGITGGAETAEAVGMNPKSINGIIAQLITRHLVYKRRPTSKTIQIFATARGREYLKAHAK